MKFTNKYAGRATLNCGGSFIGKGIEILKSKIFGEKDHGEASGNISTLVEWNGELSLDISVEEMIELQKEYGEDFIRNVKFMKEELRPVCKEIMNCFDDAVKSATKTINDCNMQMYLAKHELEKIKKEDELKDAIKNHCDE